MKFFNKKELSLRESFVTASTFAPRACKLREAVQFALSRLLRCCAPRNDSGVSLIITILFVSALMLVLAGLAEVHIKTMRNIANRENASKVKYLAESVENIAGYLAGNRGSGWNSSDADMTVYENMILESARDMGVRVCTAASPCAGMRIMGRSDSDVSANGKIKLLGTEYYSAPAVYVDAAGKKESTGNGSSTCALSESDDNFANDPCNWNKLSVGETVEIPLYYKDSAGEHKLIPPALGSDAQFKLRVRAPGHPANTGEYLFPKMSVDPKAPYRNIKGDPVLMQWMIYGTKAGISKALIANDKSSGGIRDSKLVENNTEISGGRINEGALFDDNLSDFMVLEENHQGKPIVTDGSISSDTPPIKDFDVDYPILRLNLVGQPKKSQINDGGIDIYDPATDSNDFRFNLPYLEYQVLANEPFSDSKSTITGWAQVGDYRKEFKKYVKREATLGGYAFEQF